MPTGPGRTTLAKPSPTPPTTAVPQSGPITSTPASAARCLRRTSCSSGTLSLKTMVSRPASTASSASAKAYWPGVETSATVVVGSTALAAAATVADGGAEPKPPVAGRDEAARAASTSARAAASMSSESASRATIISLPPRPAGTSNPIPAASSRLRSVAIATRAALTPSSAPTRLLTCISVTEST